MPSDVATLLAFAAAFDRRTLGEADVLAWHTVLADVDLDDARQAVSAHYADTRDWIMPADIRQRVRTARSSAAADFQGPGLAAEIPDADPDDVPAYLAALRGQRTRAALGQPTRPRAVAELTAGVGQAIPVELAAVRRPGALGVSCSTCKAAIGHSCKTPAKKPRAPHAARRSAVRAA